MAVYTKLNFAEINNLVNQYDIGNLLSFQEIEEGSENSNYLLATETARFILTIYEQRVAEKDLPFFLGLTEYLSKSHLPCPSPIHDKSGTILQEVKNKKAAILSFLNGKSITEINKSHCFECGDALAHMHILTADFKPSRQNTMGRETWHDLFQKTEGRLGEINIDAKKITNLLAELDKNWPKDLPQGVIHADLFPDNVFFLGNKLTGLIDFYFACNDFFAYDLAISLNSWCFVDDILNIEKAKAMISGYEQVRKLTAGERKNLHILLKGAALRFLLTRAYDWLNPKSEGAKKRDPLEYWQKILYWGNNNADAILA